MNPPLPFKELVKIIASDPERGDVPEYDYIYPDPDELPHTDQSSTEVIKEIVNENKQSLHDYDDSATTPNYLPRGTVTNLLTTTAKPSEDDQAVDWSTTQRNVTNLLTTTTKPSEDDQTSFDWNFTFSITIALFLLLCLALPCGLFCIKRIIKRKRSRSSKSKRTKENKSSKNESKDESGNDHEPLTANVEQSESHSSTDRPSVRFALENENTVISP